MKTNNLNLGKYDLKKLTNDMPLLDQIQANLMAIEGTTFLCNVIRDAAKTDIAGCIKMVAEQYRDNPPLIIKIVGRDTLKLIEDFTHETLANDLNNIFD